MKAIFFLTFFCILSCGPSVDNSKVIKNIGTNTAEQLINENKKLIIIDVRTADEVANGSISGAINIDVKRDDFNEKINQLNKDDTYLVFCRSGKRSVIAANLMEKANFNNLYNLEGGFLQWEEDHK